MTSLLAALFITHGQASAKFTVTCTVRPSVQIGGIVYQPEPTAPTPIVIGNTVIF